VCQLGLEFTAKHGKITDVSIDYNGQLDRGPIESSLLNKDLHQITNWEDFLPPSMIEDGNREVPLGPGRVLNELFGVGSYPPSTYVKD
jgi:lipoate---protein ligase